MSGESYFEKTDKTGTELIFGAPGEDKNKSVPQLLCVY